MFFDNIDTKIDPKNKDISNKQTYRIRSWICKISKQAKIYNAFLR